MRVISTTGDRRPQPLSEIAGEGVFTKELEAALLQREIDIAVHSLKDLPTTIHHRLTLAAVTRREDPRDALVALGGRTLARFRSERASARAACAERPSCASCGRTWRSIPMRGNVDTRVRMVDSGEMEAIIVAAAALSRLGLLDGRRS